MPTVRDYVNMYRSGGMGDPFSLRIPKKLRKMKVGRALGRFATSALSFVPGLGAVLSPLAQKLVNIGAKYGVDQDTMLGFARSYGLDVGDPGPQPKRKTAGAGPKAKAAKKAQKRATPVKSAKKGGVPNIGLPNIEIPPGMMQEIAKAAGNLVPGGPKAIGISSHPGFGRGGRRSMNPTNVKAIRRAVRRLEGFGRVIKSVRKAARGLKGEVLGTHHQVARTGGHRAGCRCAICKRAA